VSSSALPELSQGELDVLVTPLIEVGSSRWDWQSLQLILRNNASLEVPVNA